MDEQTLSIIHAVAAILAAVGTLAAVIVALYLARRDEGQRLEVQADTGGYISRHRNSGFGIVIAATNVGRRSVRLNGLECRYRVAGKPSRLRLNPLESDPGSSPMPIRLDDGDQAFYPMPFTDFHDHLAKLNDRDRAEAIRSLRFVVCVSGGRDVTAKPSRLLRRYLAEPERLKAELMASQSAA